MNPIRVLITDDHILMREGLKRLFALMPEVCVIGEASDGPEALEILARGGTDLLLLDLTMPGFSGDELIVRLRARHPHLPILILSMHNEAQIAQRAMRAGALGYVTKDSDPAVLLAAIRKVASGQRFLAPEIAERIAFAECGGSEDMDVSALSSRELQVMRMLADGVGVNEIARQLCISNKTVSTHKARLMDKMHFACNADIVKYVIANGLAV